MTADIREDLTRRDPRERISKSFIRKAETCGNAAWLSIHDPRSWSPPEKVSFGSAVDAGVELLIAYLRSGQPPDLTRAIQGAMERVKDDPNQPDAGEVLVALKSWLDWEVARETDFSYAVTQPHIRLELPGIGEVDAHPDLILRDDGGHEHIIDIKTAKAAKPANAAATSYTELGFYALLREAETGGEVATVAYWTWVRSKKPYWQSVWAPVTPHLLGVARRRVAAVARALEADTLLNDGVATPINSVFVAPPRYGCGDCEHHPSAGGSCDWAEELEEAA